MTVRASLRKETFPLRYSFTHRIRAEGMKRLRNAIEYKLESTADGAWGVHDAAAGVVPLVSSHAIVNDIDSLRHRV